MTGVAANEQAQALLALREEMVALRAKNDLRAVMATPAGRRFIWGFIEHAGVMGPSFASDAQATAYNEGRRSIGIGLLVRCQTDATDLYVTALTEQLAEQRAEASTREAANAAPAAAPEDE